MNKVNIKSTLISNGVDFSEDFHTLSSFKVELLLEAAKACKYRKPSSANGSTARYFFHHLAKM